MAYVLLAACGGSGGDDTVTPLDAATGADGAPNADAAPAACTISTPSFGDKGALTGTALIDVGGLANDATDDVLEFDAPLEPAAPADTVSVILYAGYGAFASGAIVPGTYQITGDELDFATCGVCVVIGTNATSTGYDDDYMATGGTVTITAVGTAAGQTLAGSLSNLQFHHVDIAPSTGTTTQAADTCTTAITTATFTGTLAAPMM